MSVLTGFPCIQPYIFSEKKKIEETGTSKTEAYRSSTAKVGVFFPASISDMCDLDILRSYKNPIQS